jgi:signal transduction histidine kinase
MSLAERELFGAAGIKSILSVPVITETGFWGFVGFDSFTNYNQWSSSVIALLQMAARAIASAINRMLAEKRQLEIERQMQQSQKLESLGVLAGGIAHDFNNILMAIMGHSDLALQDLSPLSPVRENLVEIERASKRAADLCKQMLAYSGRGRFVLEKINLNELIREMIYLLRSSISKKAVLNMNLDEKIVLVEGDATQIRQIVMNLIINASDALNDAMGVITITTSEEEYSSDQLSQMDHGVDLRVGRYAKIEVIDTGTGMQSEVIAKIFDPFFTTKFTGRGLGLAAVLGIVRSHQGALSVTSEPGMGTNFTILFPACEKNNDRNSEQTGEGRAITHQNYKTVLLVDDEESVRNLGRLMLERCGYRVLTAANGLEAIEKYVHNADKISCTMLDLTMPVMDGEEAFNKIKAIYPDACIIITSGYDKEEIEQRFMGSDLAGVIEKPYRLEKLASALKEILETREK